MVSYISGGYARVNLNGKNRLVSNSVASDIDIFHSVQDENFKYKFNERKVYYDEDYKTPREKFEEILAKQGVIGKFIDKMKNSYAIFSLMEMKGSLEVEDILNKYENGNLREYDAYETVENYEKNQKFLISFFLNTVTLLTFLSIFILLRIFATEIAAAITTSCLISGGIRLGLEKLESATNSIKNKTSPPYRIFMPVCKIT